MGIQKMTDFFQRDDGSLQQGLATLATKYFDATSEHNKHSETLLKHIDFQQFNNKPWDTVVQSILKGEVVGDILESGSEAIKTAIKSGATILTESAEAAGGGLIVGALTDLVVDAATDMFKQKTEIFETYERGSWVYINRGHDHNKEKQRNELEAESLMFGDYDTEMQAFESKMMYAFDARKHRRLFECPLKMATQAMHFRASIPLVGDGLHSARDLQHTTRTLKGKRRLRIG